MVLNFFRQSDSPMDEIEARVHQMIIDAHAVYETAMGAVFGGGKSKQTKNEVKSTDHEINVAQQDVRRALVMHAAVSPGTDVAATLTFMSIVKDIERIGDYAKNLYDLAKYGVDFEAAEDHDELAAYRDAVGQLLLDAADTYESGDTEHADALVTKADGFLSDYDAHVKAAYKSDWSAEDAVARALYFRFLKRITAHVMNTMTSLVLPIDMLDYYDEPRGFDDESDV